jgi:protocatechuate 3,4-dioxygenase, beta subunit
MVTVDCDDRRRRLLGGLVLGVLALRVAPAAAQLTRTPRQTEGPFYPDKLPLDTDNDLVVVNAGAAARGELTHLSGRILDAGGAPIKNAVVEIWQVDHNGVYLHSGSAGGTRRDGGFQGFGRFVTGPSGEYYFRTIKPVPYPGRTPHIHFAVVRKGQERFTTQCYIQGEPRNERDGLLNGIREPRARASVIVPFVPLEGTPGELAARFDIVLGLTPAA